MASTSKKGKKRAAYQSDDLSDSDCFHSFYKRRQLEQTKVIRKHSQTLCDNDCSSVDGCFNNNTRSTKKINIIGKVHKVTSKDNENSYRNRNVLGLSRIDNNANTEFRRNNRRNHIGSENNTSLSYDSDDTTSFDSLKSLNWAKQKFGVQSNVNKHGKESIKDTTVRCSELIDNVTNEDKFNKSNIKVRNTRMKQNKQENEEKQNTAQNFKPYIIKIITEFEQMFSKFKLRVNHLQLKYLKDEIVAQQDAENIIFIISCIISKIKEELSEQQQNLTNLFLQQSMKYHCKHIVTNLRHKRPVKTRNLYVRTKQYSESSSDTEILPLNTCKRLSLPVTKSSRNNSDYSESENIATKSSIRSSKHKLPLERNYRSTVTAQSNNNNTSLNSHEGLPHILSNLKEINVSRRPVVDLRNTKSNVFRSKPLIPEHKVTTEHSATIGQNAVQARPMVEKGFLFNSDNDVSSTCSTVELYHCEDNYVQQKDRNKDGLIYRYVHSCGDRPVPNVSSSSEILDNEVESINIQYSDSDETIITRNNRTINFNSQNSRDKHKNHTQVERKTILAPANSEKFISKQQFIISDKNNSVMRYKRNQRLDLPDVVVKQKLTERNKNNVDKKLLMDCRVLIEKIRLSVT